MGLSCSQRTTTTTSTWGTRRERRRTPRARADEPVAVDSVRLGGGRGRTAVRGRGRRRMLCRRGPLRRATKRPRRAPPLRCPPNPDPCAPGSHRVRSDDPMDGVARDPAAGVAARFRRAATPVVGDRGGSRPCGGLHVGSAGRTAGFGRTRRRVCVARRPHDHRRIARRRAGRRLDGCRDRPRPGRAGMVPDRRGARRRSFEACDRDDDRARRRRARRSPGPGAPCDVWRPPEDAASREGDAQSVDDHGRTVRTTRSGCGSLQRTRRSRPHDRPGRPRDPV